MEHSIFGWIFIGIVAGWLAGTITHGGDFGPIADLFQGLIGAVLGGWIFSLKAPSNPFLPQTHPTKCAGFGLARGGLVGQTNPLGHAIRCIGFALCLVVFPGAAYGQAGTAEAQDSHAAKQARAFKEFSDLVQQYVELRKKLDASLPPLGAKETQEAIVEHQKALAQKIRGERSAAKKGDVFAPEIAEEFRRLIRIELRGPKGSRARKTIRQGEPLKPLRLRVNHTYPEGLPVTTVPPTLLLKLPQLPQEVAYRIVGRDLILLDVEADLILDFIHDALPK